MKKETKLPTKLPKPGEVWQGFGKTIYICIEFNFNHSRDLALVGLSAPAIQKAPWLAELSLNRQLWEFYLEEGKAIKVADNWVDYLAMSATHPDKEVREVFSSLVNK